MSLKAPCEHDLYDPHSLGERLPTDGRKLSRCPGGRPATLEDLGGEKVWYCYRPRDSWGVGTYFNCQANAEQAATSKIWPFRKAGHDKCGERILLPLPPDGCRGVFVNAAEELRDGWSSTPGAEL